MAETSSLLNCRTGSRTGGSNPPPSATEGISLKTHLAKEFATRSIDFQSISLVAQQFKHV